jgi:hypothetical protein
LSPESLSVFPTTLENPPCLSPPYSTFPHTLGVIYALPKAPPLSPTPTSFPFPPVSGCLLTPTNRASGSARQTVLSCPAERGFQCTPTSPSIPIPTHSSSLHQSLSNPQYSLSWDNYRDSPTFSLSNGWTGLVSSIPLLSSWTGQRSVLVSETDPFALDASDTASQEEFEVLRGIGEKEISDNLVATGPTELCFITKPSTAPSHTQ